MNGIRGFLLCCAMVFGTSCAAPITQAGDTRGGDIDALRLVKVMADW